MAIQIGNATAGGLHNGAVKWSVRRARVVIVVDGVVVQLFRIFMGCSSGCGQCVKDVRKFLFVVEPNISLALSVLLLLVAERFLETNKTA